MLIQWLVPMLVEYIAGIYEYGLHFTCFVLNLECLISCFHVFPFSFPPPPTFLLLPPMLDLVGPETV